MLTSSQSRRGRAAAALAAAAVAGLSLAADALSQGLTRERLPYLPAPLHPGRVAAIDLGHSAPEAKVVDGAVGDWVGDRSGFAGAVHIDRGELIYEDFVFDAYGADGGDDAIMSKGRELTTKVAPELYRLFGALPRFAQFLLAANSDAGGDGVFHAGDVAVSETIREAADLTEVRVAVEGDDVVLLARTGQLRRDDDAAVLVLLDSEPGNARRPVPYGSGLTTSRAELAYLLSADGGRVIELRTGSERRLSSAHVRVRSEGWSNAFEARLPGAARGRPAIAVAAGPFDRLSGKLSDGIFNVAFRHEPVTVSMDEAQALALAGGSIDEFFQAVDPASLRSGLNEEAVPGPGYYERTFNSAPAISTEAVPRQGRVQEYGLLVPTGYGADSPTPTTLYLHFAAATTHQAAAWMPRWLRQFGEERGNLLAAPSGRGQSNFFTNVGYQDVVEVLADLKALGRDPERTYLTGYSMGSYATQLLVGLHPDWFAGAFAADGTPPSYFGLGGVYPNSLHVPIAMLAETPVNLAQQADWDVYEQSGVEGRLYVVAQHHFDPPLVDQWGEFAGFLGQRRRVRRPERVIYRRIPAVETAVSEGTTPSHAELDHRAPVEVKADGAYWVSGIRVREGDPADLSTQALVDATTDGFGHLPRQAVREFGILSPHQTMPFVMRGVRYREAGPRSPRANSFEARLDNVASVQLDLAGMGLDLGSPIVARVSSDGPTSLVLTNGVRSTTIQVGAGEQTFTIRQ